MFIVNYCHWYYCSILEQTKNGLIGQLQPGRSDKRKRKEIETKTNHSIVKITQPERPNHSPRVI